MPIIPTELCVRLESSAGRNCSNKWRGDEISLIHNGVEKRTFQFAFTNESFCLPINEVNIQNDVFELRNGGTDGVSKELFQRAFNQQCFDECL